MLIEGGASVSTLAQTTYADAWPTDDAALPLVNDAVAQASNPDSAGAIDIDERHLSWDDYSDIRQGQSGAQPHRELQTEEAGQQTQLTPAEAAQDPKARRRGVIMMATIATLVSLSLVAVGIATSVACPGPYICFPLPLVTNGTRMCDNGYTSLEARETCSPLCTPGYEAVGVYRCALGGIYPPLPSCGPRS